MAAERRTQILDAFEECILMHGIEGSSFQRIADMLGMDKMMIPHYFGNRDNLVSALIQRAVEGWKATVRTALKSGETSRDIDAIVDFYFGPEMQSGRTESIWAEVTAYSVRSRPARRLLMETYDALFRELQSMLDRDYPNAPPELRRSTAFGIGVLLDRAGTMDWLGLGREPLTLAREAISGLLNELARADESAEEREQRVGF